MSPVLIILIILIAAVLIFLVVKKEGYCSCTGLKTMTDRPTYYVYRPTGDVSNYGDPCSGNLENSLYRKAEPPQQLLEFTNLGWKKSGGLDFDGSWAARGGCNSSSVPMVSMSSPPQNCQSSYESAVLTSNTTAVPYAQNYGTPGCSLRTVATLPAVSQAPCSLQRITTPQPPYMGPAGPYSTGKCCGVNLSTPGVSSIGVL